MVERVAILMMLVAALSGCIGRRSAMAPADGLDDGADSPALSALPPGVQVVRDVAYGASEEQRLDIYRPADASGAPVVFMVHGGGWRSGDKAEGSVVGNKVGRWVPRGLIVVSANYRLLPDAGPLDQAADVARALAAAQEKAATWGGDRTRFILMGHSAGAHLVALLASDPEIARAAGAAPWLGTVVLDSAALDVVRIMEVPHLRLHDEAFGTDRAYWLKASPYQALAGATAPMLVVCSSRRVLSCAQAERFVTKARSFGTQAQVLKEDLSHREINDQLGQQGGYTHAVESFMRALDPAVAGALSR